MTADNQTFDVATVGNYTKDTIITASGTLHADGGGVTYSAHAAHTLGRMVAAITRLAKEDFHVVRTCLDDIRNLPPVSFCKEFNPLQGLQQTQRTRSRIGGISR